MQLRSRRRLAGATLIESLIALVIAVLGILGMLGMQMRTLADTQAGVRRAQAIRLIENFSERTRAHPNSLALIADYRMPWRHGGSDQAPPASPDCGRTECTPQEMSLYDMGQWMASVHQTLPGSAVLLSPLSDEDAPGNGAGNQRQLVVAIGWRDNEKSGSADLDPPHPHQDGVARRDHGCPAGKTCHFQHISLSGRCAPYFASGPVQFFCPGQ